MIVKHPLHPTGGFHMDDNLHENIIELPKRIKKDKDTLFLVCGDPGTGKSTIIQQVFYVLDPSITKTRNIHSTVEDYINYAVKLAENKTSKGKATIHDESRETGGMNVIKKRISRFWDFIYENRYLNMYQGLLQSDFWKTPRDIVYSRALFMIWVQEDENWDNGTYLFYSKRNMKKLYNRGKKLGQRSPTGYDFQGRFVKFWAGNPEYLKIKDENFIKKYKQEIKEKPMLLKDAQLLAMERNPDYFKPIIFAKLFGCDVSQVFKYMKQWENGEI
jgi:hypothetical protein